jgi:hypothetical protein
MLYEPENYQAIVQYIRYKLILYQCVWPQTVISPTDPQIQYAGNDGILQEIWGVSLAISSKFKSRKGISNKSLSFLQDLPLLIVFDKAFGKIRLVDLYAIPLEISEDKHTLLSRSEGSCRKMSPWGWVSWAMSITSVSKINDSTVANLWSFYW